MKQIQVVILFLLFAENIALAADVDITGEWIVREDDAGDAGIIVTIRETIGEKTYSYSYAGEVSDDVIRFDVRPPANSGDRFQFTVKRVTP